MDRSAATEQSGHEPVPVPPLPSIADYWPDRPVAASVAPDEPTVSTRTEPVTPRPEPDDGITWIQAPETPSNRRARRTLGGAVALAVLVVIGAVMATLIKQAHDEPTGAAAPAVSARPSAAAPAPTGAAIVAPPPAVASASAVPTTRPSGNVGVPQVPKLPAAGTFEVAASVDSVTVRSQNLGADLYRVTLGKSNGPVTPKIRNSGTNHRLTLVKDVDTAAPPVTVTLNSALRWSLKMSAGNTETRLNLAGSRIVAVELAGGARVFELTLPPVSGTLPLRVTHGMNQLKVKTNHVPVRVTLRAGAGKVTLDGVTDQDIKRGRVFTQRAWPTATDRVDLDAVGGLGTLTVDTD